MIKCNRYYTTVCRNEKCCSQCNDDYCTERCDEQPEQCEYALNKDKGENK